MNKMTCTTHYKREVHRDFW